MSYFVAPLQTFFVVISTAQMYDIGRGVFCWINLIQLLLLSGVFWASCVVSCLGWNVPHGTLESGAIPTWGARVCYFERTLCSLQWGWDVDFCADQEVAWAPPRAKRWCERPCVVLRRFDQGDVIFGAQDIYDTELFAKRWTRDQPPEPSEWLAACARCIFVGGGFLRNVQASRGVALIIL